MSNRHNIYERIEKKQYMNTPHFGGDQVKTDNNSEYDLTTGTTFWSQIINELIRENGMTILTDKRYHGMWRKRSDEEQDSSQQKITLAQVKSLSFLGYSFSIKVKNHRFKKKL